MRQAEILFKGEKAGILIQNDEGSFVFQYDREWVDNNDKPPISLTLPKTHKTYQANHLFPFFYNMLPEGINKRVVCQSMQMDKDDYFGILLTTARFDTIGAITVKRLAATV